MKKFNYKSRKGFTLIELLVVIGILAVLAAIAIPSVAGLIDRANVSSDDTNANEMTNAIERFVSEYELYCQDIASNRIDFDDLDSAQSRVYNVTAIEKREHITQIENGGYINRKLDKDTKYPDDYGTTVAIIQNYTKTSSSTFEPKQSDMHFWYSPDCGVVVYGEPESATSVLNAKVISGKDAKGKELTGATRWIDITTGEESEYIANYSSEEIANNPLLFGIGKTSPEYVLAEFNEDFTEVTIFKNGENSDGLIKQFPANSSPMTEHASTLIKATYREGIMNTGAYAFYNCALLSEVQFSNSLTEISYASFGYNDALKEIVIPENVELIDYSAFRKGSSLSSVTFKTNVLNKIQNGAFDGCVNLTEISIPEGVTLIGNEVFKNCVKLVTVELPSTLQKIGAYAFYNCYRMTTANIPDSVTVIESNAFDSCKVLENIKLPPQIKTLGPYAFQNCLKIESIYIPSTLEYYYNNVFNECTNLKKVEVAHIEDNSLRTIYYISSAFSNCSNIEEIILPDNKFETHSAMFSSTAFYKNTNNWDSNSALYINNHFFECKSTTITEYTIKDGTISVAAIAFRQNSQLTSITIPASVQHISNKAFYYCSSLSTIYGESGSYAETWANEHGYTFVAQ